LTLPLVVSWRFCFKPEEQLVWLKIDLVLELHLLTYRAEGQGLGDLFCSFLLGFLKSFTLPGNRCWENKAET